MSRWVDIKNLAIDAVAGALAVVDYAHHEIHDGHSFAINDVVAVSTTTQKWLVTTPNTAKECHAIIAVECTGEVLLTVTEGADRAGTTPLTAINRNRNSASSATTTVHRGISGGTTDGATTIMTVRSGATGAAARTIEGGGSRGLNEHVLKKNTKYVIAAETFAAVNVTLELDWYEHTPGTAE